jgi:DNA-binding HxlR family transcriptional regulator
LGMTRASASLPADPFDPNCPSRGLLDRIGDRWSVLVLLSLGERGHRFGELAHRVGGISQKMLTQTLRALERDGLVTRTVHAQVPPRVDYDLTALGSSLLDLMHGLDSWARAHVDDVQAARQAFDAAGR